MSIIILDNNAIFLYALVMTLRQQRKVVNGVWYEVCVSQGGEIRDVIIESNEKDAGDRVVKLVNQWPDCEMVFVRQHRADKKRGPGASKFVVLHKHTADFRVKA